MTEEELKSVKPGTYLRLVNKIQADLFGEWILISKIYKYGGKYYAETERTKARSRAAFSSSELDLIVEPNDLLRKMIGAK